MTQAAFTSGPWRADGSFSNRNGSHPYHVRGPYLGMGNIAKVNKRETDEEAKANACLIAAAPDLYEALQRARRVLIEFNHYSEDGLEIRSIDEILAKARGEQGL